MKILKNNLSKFTALAVVTSMTMVQAHAQTVGDIAVNVSSQVENVGKLLVVAAVLIGVGFVIAGLMKLKAASDSGGTQVKYGEGIWRLAVGAGLVAVPALTGVLTSSLGIDGASITTGAGF